MERKRFTFYLEEEPLLRLRAWLDKKNLSVSEYLNALIKVEADEIESGRKESLERIPVKVIEKVVGDVLDEMHRRYKKVKGEKKENEEEKESKKKMVL